MNHLSQAGSHGNQTGLSEILAEALPLLRLGLSVIPVHGPGMPLPQHGRPGSEGKVPLLTSWKSYQQQLATERTIRLWAKWWRHANIGIVTGSLSGVIVLDVDGEEGLRSLQQLGIQSLPETWIAKTGNGYHLYFRHPGGAVKNFVRKLPGLDLRGDGGYVVAPPSQHADGSRYEWLKGPYD